VGITKFYCLLLNLFACLLYKLQFFIFSSIFKFNFSSNIITFYKKNLLKDFSR